jgi:hypothetical protein
MDSKHDSKNNWLLLNDFRNQNFPFGWFLAIVSLIFFHQNEKDFWKSPQNLFYLINEIIWSIYTKANLYITFCDNKEIIALCRFSIYFFLSQLILDYNYDEVISLLYVIIHIFNALICEIVLNYIEYIIEYFDNILINTLTIKIDANLNDIIWHCFMMLPHVIIFCSKKCSSHALWISYIFVLIFWY